MGNYWLRNLLRPFESEPDCRKKRLFHRDFLSFCCVMIALDLSVESARCEKIQYSWANESRFYVSLRAPAWSRSSRNFLWRSLSGQHGASVISSNARQQNEFLIACTSQDNILLCYRFVKKTWFDEENVSADVCKKSSALKDFKVSAWLYRVFDSWRALILSF